MRGLIVRLVLALLASFPLAFVTAILSAPFWNWFEARTGIESIGHSGPADWVFWTLWVIWIIVLFAAAQLLFRKREYPR